MTFCEKCGTQFSAAYCTKCGVAKQQPLPPMSSTLAESKFCTSCGKAVAAAHCTGCGTALALTVNVGKSSAFTARPAGAAPAAGSTALPIPIEWLLMGITFLFALSTMNWFGGLMLIVVLIPAAVLIYDSALYAKFKLFLSAGAAGFGLLFAVLATFTGTARFQILALILCILGLLFVAFIGVRDMLKLKLPGEFEKILALIESPMYFYMLAVYFTIATVFTRGVAILDLRFAGLGREVFSVNLSGGRIFVSLIISIVLLAVPAAIAYVRWRGIQGLLDKLLVALGGVALFAVFIMPLFFRRGVGVPILYIILGYGAVALVGLLLFFLKNMVLEVFNMTSEGTTTNTTSGAQATASPQAPRPVGQTAGVATAVPDASGNTTVNVNVTMTAPVGQLKTNRSLLLYILLSPITFGIYPIIVMSGISTDINIIAQRYDGRRTMHYCLLLFIIAPITFGIGAIVWTHKLCSRIGRELARRGIPYSFGAATFWLWGVLGCLIIVGPIIYMYKFLKAMNLLSAHYNVNG